MDGCIAARPIAASAVHRIDCMVTVMVVKVMAGTRMAAADAAHRLS